MLGLKRWHLGALLPLLWFGYHVWSEWHYQHERETRFTGRTATDDWTSSASPFEKPLGRPLCCRLQKTLSNSRSLRPPDYPFTARSGRIQILRNAGFTVGLGSASNDR